MIIYDDDFPHLCWNGSNVGVKKPIERTRYAIVET